MKWLMRVYLDGDMNNHEDHIFEDIETGTSEKYELMKRLFVGPNDKFEVTK